MKNNLITNHNSIPQSQYAFSLLICYSSQPAGFSMSPYAFVKK